MGSKGGDFTSSMGKYTSSMKSFTSGGGDMMGGGMIDQFFKMDGKSKTAFLDMKKWNSWSKKYTGGLKYKVTELGTWTDKAKMGSKFYKIEFFGNSKDKKKDLKMKWQETVS